MPNFVSIEPLAREKFDAYIALGKKSYLQHYLDFWADSDPTPYIDESFTEEVVHKDFNDCNTMLFIIYSNELPVGIVKIIKDKKVGRYSEKESLLLQKIYLVEEHSHQGIGSSVLTLVENLARALQKKLVWLEIMAKGTTLAFYLKNGYHIHATKQIGYETIKDDKREMYVMVKEL